MKIVDEMPIKDGKVIRLSVWKTYSGEEVEAENLKIIGGKLYWYCDGYEEWLEDDEDMTKALEIKWLVP